MAAKLTCPAGEGRPRESLDEYRVPVYIHSGVTFAKPPGVPLGVRDPCSVIEGFQLARQAFVAGGRRGGSDELLLVGS